MTMPYIPPPAARSTGLTGIRSVAGFRAQFRRGLPAVTGQSATLTRASTGTITDSAGATITVGHSMPRFESRTYDGAPAIGLRLATDDLSYPCQWLPGTGTLYIDFIEVGTLAVADAGLVAIANAGATGGVLYVRRNGAGGYGCAVGNGTDTATADLSTGNPSVGETARICCQVEDSGTEQRVRLISFVGGVTTTTAWSAWITRTATWGSGAVLRLNRVGADWVQGSTWVRDVAWFPGLVSPAAAAASL